MLFDWTKNLSVGDGELDGHHQQMIGFINRLHDALQKGEERTVVSEVLGELADYANYHFGAEEAMFELKHYPDAAAHIEKHMEFRERLKELRDLFDSGDEKAGDKLIEFLFPWWTNHILEFDKKYVPYVKG